ncbi:MAG: hypothetical protein ABJA82_01100 [Myxococcales bacterium]
MRMWDPHRRIRREIAAHFAARATPSAEQEMRLHLRDCADCVEVYQRRLLIAEVDPAAVPAQVRLARGLGLSPVAWAGRAAVAGVPANPGGNTTAHATWANRSWWGWSALAGAAAMAALLLVTPVRTLRTPETRRDAAPAFVARGSSPPPAGAMPELMVYRVASRKVAPEPAGDVISARDELAFAYRNSSGRAAGTGTLGQSTGTKTTGRDFLLDYLMIFAVDEHGHVYWYHPGWTRADDNPSAIPASRQPGIHELPSAVAHQFDSKQVVIHALFSDRPLTVRQVEAAVARPGGKGPDLFGAPLRLPGALDVRRAFQVVP